MDSQPFRANIQQGIVHHKGSSPYQGKADNFIETIFFHKDTIITFYFRNLRQKPFRFFGDVVFTLFYLPWSRKYRPVHLHFRDLYYTPFFPQNEEQHRSLLPYINTRQGNRCCVSLKNRGQICSMLTGIMRTT